ncbi:MAG: hypothetical protein EBU90_23370, partial [Proteobacteria bacterium]|nr:hypothetical protein [Pseudomonadota bacterium]
MGFIIGKKYMSNFTQLAKITGNDTQSDVLFGWSVSLNSAGNIALIGAYGEDPNGVTGAGSAYIFTGSGGSWSQAAKITGSNARVSGAFGYSVSLNSAGNIALIGAYKEYPNGVAIAGSAYIFTGSGSSWVQTARITGNDTAAGDLFGSAVSLNSIGNIALIGAEEKYINGIPQVGAAYIFTGSGSSWVQTARVTGNDSQISHNFGSSVSLNSSGNIFVVGADNSNVYKGSAYIFTGNGSSWSQALKITGDSPQSFDYFGYSTSINDSGNIIAIGELRNGNGRFYIFTGNGNSWTRSARITQTGASLNNYLGYSVSLNSVGNVALVGAAAQDSSNGVLGGSAYIFTGSGNNWVQTLMMTGNDPKYADNFGSSVSLNSSGNVALVGAFREDLNGVTNAGSAYIFTEKANQTITFPSISDKNFGDPVFYLDASSDSNLPITYSSSNPSIASITGASGVNINNAGSVTITASQTGNSNYTAAVPVSRSFNVVCDYTKEISAGYFHSLALLKDGRVTGWGDNTYGQTNIPVGIGNNATGISAGLYHSLALLKDGRVTGWGWNNYFETTIPAGIGTNATGIAAGYGHSLALLKDGSVTGWGRNNNNQTTIPAGIGTNATGIAAGSEHSLALLKDGRVTGWGSNVNGQTTIPVGIGTNAAAIAAGYIHSLALLKDGRVTGWGYNFNNEITIPAGIGNNATGIAAGYGHSLALLKDGRVTGWGKNDYGQTTIPVGIGTNATGIFAGTYNSFALLKDRRVTGWGYNGNGQTNIPLGINCSFTKFTPTITFPNIPIKSISDPSFNLGVTSTNTALPITYTSSNTSVATVNSNGDVTIIGLGTTNITASQAGDANYNPATSVLRGLYVSRGCGTFVQISAGEYHSLALLKDGSITGWGFNNNGQTTIPAGIGTNATGIAAGYGHSLALLKDGRVTGWGLNNYGQITIPVGIGNNTTGIFAGQYYSLALLKDGRVTGWGLNDYGQTNIPVGIGNNATGISAGGYHCLALLKDGSITGWGRNLFGQTIIPAGIGTNATGISAGNYHSLALLKDGTVTGWGYNFNGEITIPAGIGTNATGITAGHYHSLALLKDGSITGWGKNDYGQTTIPVGIGNNATGISAGAAHSIALLKDGSITGWGRNGEGQTTNVPNPKCIQNITFPAIPTKTFGDSSFNPGATSDSNLTVNYTSSNTSVVTVAGSTITIVGGGTSTITASQAGDSIYSAATPVARTLTVNKADQTITFSAIETKTFGDPLFYLAGTSTSNLPLTYSGNNSSVATILGSGVTIVGAGTCEITGYQTGNSNYNAATPVAQTLTVLRGGQTINISGFYTGVYNETKTYDLSTPQGLPIIYTGDTNIFSIEANNITFINTGVTILTGYNTGSTNCTGITGTQQVTVNRANAIIDFPYIPVFNINLTSGYTLNATSNHSESAIEYTSSNSGAASISGSNTLLITGTGVGIITAYQPATSHYNEASGQRSFTALNIRNPQIVAVSNLPNNVFFDTGSKYLQGYLQDEGTYHLKLHILEDNILCEKTIV